MKRIILVAAGVVSAMLCWAQEKNKTIKPPVGKDQVDYRETGAPMPLLHVVTLDTLAKFYEGKDLRKMEKKMNKKLGYTPITRILTQDDLNGKGNYLFMLFNPTCGHCEDQTEVFKKNADLFKSSRLIMLAKPETRQYLPYFVESHKVRDFYPKITVGLDSADFVKETFMYGSLPQILIYNNDKKLVRMFNGEIPLDTLKQYID